MSVANGFAPGGFVAAMVGHAADAEAAVALAGGRLGERVAWGQVPAAPAAVLLIEAEGVDAGTLADTLPGLAAVAESRDLPVVAAFASEQIDTVAASLLGSSAVLLCAPRIAERVAAIAVSGAGVAPSARFREDEGERLRRLNAEVARIAALLAGLVEETGPVTVDARRSRYAAEARSEAPIHAADIRRAIRARRMRDQFFDARLLDDPGWDILLDLFAAELEGAQVSVSSLCIASGVAPTTALRWIARMVDAGLLVRVADPGDRRRAFLVLSDTASAAMRGYVAATRRAGVPIA